MSKDIIIDRTESQLDEHPQQAQPQDILMAAIKQGVDLSIIEKLVGLQERMEATKAAKAFSRAMAAFKAACPPVVRRTENSQFSVSRNGVKVARTYASLDDIAETIRGPLGRYGLSYRWTDMIVDGGKLTVSCVISHEEGHSESSSATVPTASSAGCSEIQKMGSAQTYAMRYSLIAALGLTSCDHDDDGQGEPAGETIDEGQVFVMDALIGEVGADRAKFLKYANVTTLQEIPKSQYARYMTMIESKRAKA